MQQDPLVPQSSDEYLSIRKRLRQWQEENQVEAPPPIPLDMSDSGMPRNTGTRARVANDTVLERATAELTTDLQIIDRDGVVDLPPPTKFGPGDVFEFREESDRNGIPIIAVCLGYFHGHYHFYTANGLWVVATGSETYFIHRNFAAESELQPLIDKIPKGNLSRESIKEMRRQGLGPDRVAGAVILRKMNQFLEATDEMLQKYATRFEKAHEIVSEGDERYLTLEQIKQRLLAKEELESPTPPHVLYAVHRIVFSDDVGFRIAGNLHDDSTSPWVFEVTAREDVSLIQNMQTLVRLFTDLPGRLDTPLSSLTTSQLNQSQLGRFIVRARAAIDESRQIRDWTPYGVLGPAKQQRSTTSQAWTNVDTSILRFMLMWAGYEQFAPSSRLHWIGSAILRATGKYKDVEFLSASTAWTFLQEVGYISPWELRERYIQRVPGVTISRQGGFEPFKLGPEGIRPYLTRDVFEGKRHDWASLKSFAIDSKHTLDVDDAVSVEPTDAPDQHWIHIHVADPASRIRHQNALGQRASITPLTLYLQGHYSNIWGLGNEVQDLFSLAPNKPCLTFSGLVNDDGELLEYKITAARLQEFIYMTPEDANAAAGVEVEDARPESGNSAPFTVGEAIGEGPAVRKMTSASELQPEDVRSLKTLYRLAEARQQRRLAKGATPKWPAQAKVDAFFHNTSIKPTTAGLLTCSGDPTFRISWDNSQSSMIASTMVLAGEIAARWCADRAIPIPYLSQPDAEKNEEALKAYTETVYYPLLMKGEEYPEHFEQLLNLVGESKLSTKPARHYFMGVDMYTKVTSPLRRYSDLISHWQIENALAQEMDQGKVVERKLPFSRKELDQEILPWLRLRQTLIRRLMSRGAPWKGYGTQALVRAWKYPVPGQSDLPKTFILKVLKVEQDASAAQGRRKLIRGSVDWFNMKVWVVAEGLGKLGLNVKDVRKGDVLEVKLADINAHLGDVYVEAVNKISVQKDRDMEELNVEGSEEGTKEPES